MKAKAPYIVKTISELHQLLGLPKPKHPLISIYRFSQITQKEGKLLDYFCPQFYSIAIKNNYKGKVRYGHSHYDFDEGTMCFIGIGQLLAQTAGSNTPEDGFCLMIHPDFLAGYPLATKIKTYGFFSYELNEALHLSDEENTRIEQIITEIETEYESRIDILSQDVMISHIELLLHYAQRFYNRQFITRKSVNTDLLKKLDEVLENYLRDEATTKGLPTVQQIAARLNVSPNYLSDMLRTTTGYSTQQHIQNKLIEKSKELLLSGDASVGEIAYQLGFERPQSLSKLFRNLTGLTPSDFRKQMN
ncbi:helix-turn-helix domain-containing protein [Chitinophaga pinensis]|uniref:Helix-turn-helix transcriptional regulator n=1 Tax=Chitinophaga pinensis TaxID=79329 RepID=A0A5C6LNJ6_9BACT|nr:helix-turn-helix transcriptional regulator [Chitinophaga pinensis]TWV90765.1 helix-turn-helix transcriptional regulator [Chitinophaga pinensis]